MVYHIIEIATRHVCIQDMEKKIRFSAGRSSGQRKYGFKSRNNYGLKITTPEYISKIPVVF